jgi:glutamate 5-kinase
MRLTIKIGSNVLTRSDGSLDVTRMSALVDQIAELRQQGHEVILVSSGAVASGRSELKHIQHDLDSARQRQLFSAVGQAKLINRYFELFREYGIAVGQVLTTKENFADSEHRQNQENCIGVMLENGVLPIVNENDTVSITELMFTDNDELSGLIAQMTDSDMLIILSNIDGLYTGQPSDPASRLISIVKPGKDLSDYIQPSKSSAGRGGMQSKSSVAQRTAAAGIGVVIANGKREGILVRLMNDRDNTPCTEFLI